MGGCNVVTQLLVHAVTAAWRHTGSGDIQEDTQLGVNHRGGAVRTEYMGTPEVWDTMADMVRLGRVMRGCIMNTVGRVSIA